ncbi:hypothetical protein JCM11641_004817 [Rhodosporidiobolus odoratus]
MPLPPPEPLHHVQTLLGKKYRNPWPSAASPALCELFSGPWLGLPKTELREAALSGRGVQDVEVVKPDWGRKEMKRRRKVEPESDFVRGTWIGHAGAFIEIPVTGTDPSPSTSASSSSTRPSTVKLLFDPIFSARAGPGGYFGPRRMRAPPCEVKDLPAVDMVFISHNHYDHLDLPTIVAIKERGPKTEYFVGLGNKPWFTALGIPASRVFEHDWWEETDIEGHNGEVIRVTCVPSQHTSGRGVLDQRATLWCGWVVERLVPASPTAVKKLSSSYATVLPAPSSPPPDSLSPFSDSHAVDYLDRAKQPASQDSSAQRSLGRSTSDTPKDSPNEPLLVDPSRYVRPASKREKRLKGVWVRKGAVYHAGDTGYRPFYGSLTVCPAFASLGANYGPFDLSFVPIWRGGTMGFVSAMGLRLCHQNLPCATHGSPGDGVDIHLDVRSRNTIGMHFGTFEGSTLEELEALTELKREIKAAKVLPLHSRKEDSPNGRMGWTNIGETHVVKVLEHLVED